MAGPGDKPIDLSEFTADVAARTSESEEALTRRASTDPSEDALWTAVRHRPEYELQAEREALEGITSQYPDELKRLFRWFGGNQDWDPEGGVLNPIAGEREGFAPPSVEEIRDALAENPELYAEKIRQGFTRLLIVPEGGHLAWMLDAYTRTVSKLARGGVLGSEYSDAAGYEQIRFSLDHMARADLWGYVVDENTDELQTKEERIQTKGRDAAWRAYLVQDTAERELRNPLATEKALIMPSQTVMVVTQRGETYDWSILGTDLTEGEVGLTPESYIALSMQYLLEHDDLLDTDGTTALFGIRAHDESLGMPYMSRRSGSHKLGFSISDGHLHAPGDRQYVVDGVRTAVPIRMPLSEDGGS